MDLNLIAKPAEARRQLWELLGAIPPPFPPRVRRIAKREEAAYTLEHFRFQNGLGDTVYGYLLLPKGVDFPAPALLYHHEHGGKYTLGKDAALRVRENGYAPGIALAEAGFIVLAIDAYGFGERETLGPGGAAERGASAEQTLFKQFLWQGRTLWGMMLHDDLCALAYLSSCCEVDAARIGTAGMSLGGSRSTWVAALDASVKAVVPISQLTRYRDFADSGSYRLHSIYYYVPGMLASGFDMEQIVALTAPRHQLILTGDSDPLSPISGIHKVMAYASEAYRQADAADKLELVLYEGVSHAYLPAMMEAMLAFFKRVL